MVLAWYKKSLLACGTALYVLSSFLLPTLAREQSEFPGRRVGGGSRGECDAELDSFVALNPSDHLGLTRQGRPTLYFAVAESTEPYDVQLTVMNPVEDDSPYEILHEMTLEVGDTRELIGIQLPADILLLGEDYLWQFVVLCEPDDPSRNIVLEGWIRQDAQHVLNVTASDVSVAETLAQAQAYQTSGLWLDAIALSVELLASDPHLEAVQNQWSQLLQALELDAVLDDTFGIRPAGDPH
jgi:hypothetical protein